MIKIKGDKKRNANKIKIQNFPLSRINGFSTLRFSEDPRLDSGSVVTTNCIVGNFSCGDDAAICKNLANKSVVNMKYSANDFQPFKINLIPGGPIDEYRYQVLVRDVTGNIIKNGATSIFRNTDGTSTNTTVYLPKPIPSGNYIFQLITKTCATFSSTNLFIRHFNIIVPPVTKSEVPAEEFTTYLSCKAEK